jgi:hypothetical protein
MKASKTKPPSAEQQIRDSLARFQPKHRALIRTVRKALRKRFPSANELVYDYSRNFVIGYSPTERGLEAVAAIALDEDGLRLHLSAKLPDPKRILLGSTGLTRFIWIESPGTLILPEVKALLKAALDRAKPSLRPIGRGALIIKSASAKRRSKRKMQR